jgi:hypothetical protein
MDNPFTKRATEFLRDEEAFLAIVSPEPVTLFLKKPAQSGSLYDRLVLLRGTPGSGKTTLARLFEYPSLSALLRNRGLSTYDDLVAALVDCRAIVNEQPTCIGCRLPMESEYREFWELPYGDSLKLGLTCERGNGCPYDWRTIRRAVGDASKGRGKRRVPCYGSFGRSARGRSSRGSNWSLSTL